MSDQESAAQPTPEEAVEVVEAEPEAAPVAEPQPVEEAAAAPAPEPEPPPTFSAAPAGWPESAADDRPEVTVGAAFAGGIAAAWVLKRLARRKHRR